jgi:hypothetical protein
MSGQHDVLAAVDSPVSQVRKLSPSLCHGNLKWHDVMLSQNVQNVQLHTIARDDATTKPGEPARAGLLPRRDELDRAFVRGTTSGDPWLPSVDGPVCSQADPLLGRWHYRICLCVRSLICYGDQATSVAQRSAASMIRSHTGFFTS